MKKAISIFLSFILLLGNFGFTLATHYCAGHAVETAFFIGEQDLDCGMMDMDQESDNQGEENAVIHRKSGCENKYIAIDLKDDFNNNLKSEIHLNSQLAYLIEDSYKLNVIALINDNKPFILYLPPLLTHNIQVLFQSFLI